MATLAGIDISSNQKTTPNLTGLSFALAKATEGLWHDPMYAHHMAKFRAAKLPVVGAYHFSRSDVATPEAQAREFLKAAGEVDIYALDVEGAHAFNRTQALAFVTEMHRHGKKCGLYMSREAPFMTKVGDWNWVADYRAGSVPNIPWAIWQWTSSNGKLDRNYFNGNLSALLAFANKSTGGATVADTPATVIAKNLVYALNVIKAGQPERAPGYLAKAQAALETLPAAGNSPLQTVTVTGRDLTIK